MWLSLQKCAKHIYIYMFIFYICSFSYICAIYICSFSIYVHFHIYVLNIYIYIYMFIFSGEPLLIHHLYFLSLCLFLLVSLSLITPPWNYISFLLVSEVTGTFNGKQWSNCFPLRGDSPHKLTVWLGGFLVLILPYILRASISLFPQHLFLDFFGCISFVDEWPCSLPMGWIGWMRGEERVAYGYGPTVLVIMEST